jgi:myo-inositol-1-phosphate synthase
LSKSKKSKKKDKSKRSSGRKFGRQNAPLAKRTAKLSKNSKDSIPRSSKGIRVALIGVGNVASAFVQMIYAGDVKGIWHERIGGFERTDLKIVGVFDIDARKVGRDLSEAIFAEPNVTPRFSEVGQTGIVVQPGIANYEIPKHIMGTPVKSDDFGELLKACQADVVLNLIPSGMHQTSYEYAEAALRAGSSFVNATPSSVATDAALVRRFENAGLVIVGDDLLSQFGGTAFHKGILDFMNSRGLQIEKSYQLDVGGGSETLNTINEEIKLDKREIKTGSISEEIPYKFETVAGTTDYVDYLGNNRTSYFWIQAKTLFDSDIKIDVYLRTNDGANAGNILLDVTRAVSKAKSQRRYGSQQEICDYGFKKPLRPALLRKAHEEFFARYG